MPAQRPEQNDGPDTAGDGGSSKQVRLRVIGGVQLRRKETKISFVFFMHVSFLPILSKFNSRV